MISINKYIMGIGYIYMMDKDNDIDLSWRVDCEDKGYIHVDLSLVDSPSKRFIVCDDISFIVWLEPKSHIVAAAHSNSLIDFYSGGALGLTKKI